MLQDNGRYHNDMMVEIVATVREAGTYSEVVLKETASHTVVGTADMTKDEAVGSVKNSLRRMFSDVENEVFGGLEDVQERSQQLADAHAVEELSVDQKK
jgi:hypothetical protein